MVILAFVLLLVLSKVIIVSEQCEPIEKLVIKVLSQGHNKNHLGRLSIKLASFCLQVRVLSPKAILLIEKNIDI